MAQCTAHCLLSVELANWRRQDGPHTLIVGPTVAEQNKWPTNYNSSPLVVSFCQARLDLANLEVSYKRRTKVTSLGRVKH